MPHLRIVGFIIIRYKDEDRNLEESGSCGYWLTNFVGYSHTSAGFGWWM